MSSMAEEPSNDAVATPASPRRSSIKYTVVRNALSNWAAFGADALVAFLLTPYLIGRLGTTVYGVWILVGALAGYLGMLDFGLRISIGRHVAFHRGREDHEGILRTLNTALTALVGLGAAAWVLVMAAALQLHVLFPIPPEQLADARHALVIVGVQLAAGLPLRSFDAVLWGF